MALDKRKLSKAVKDKYSFANETFFHTAKAHLKDRIAVEIGDSKQPDFKPQVKVQRWDNEVNFSMRAVEHPQATVETEGEKIKYKTPDYEVHQYDRPEVSEDGGFEFEWFLPKKPKSNVLTATIQTKGLDFFYQPALTPEEIAEGVQRPENVVGSYAVYHKTKGRLNDANGKDYKVGKAFHIYRPEAVDAQGNKTWCELNVDVDGGLVKVTVPQEFLDSAVYPVVVDPTFGYTSAGATNYYIASFNGDANERVGYTVGPTSEVGTLVSMSVYGLTDSGVTETVTTSVLINKKDDPSAGQHGLLVKLEQDNAYTTTPTWFTFNASSESIPIDTYVLNVLADGVDVATSAKVINTRYDTTGGKTAYFDNAVANYATMSTEDPWTPTQSGTAKNISIYATYTASGGSDPTPLRMLMGMGT